MGTPRSVTAVLVCVFAGALLQGRDFMYWRAVPGRLVRMLDTEMAHLLLLACFAQLALEPWSEPETAGTQHL